MCKDSVYKDISRFKLCGNTGVKARMSVMVRCLHTFDPMDLSQIYVQIYDFITSLTVFIVCCC